MGAARLVLGRGATRSPAPIRSHDLPDAGQPPEEACSAPTDGAALVAALLHHQRWQVERANQRAVLLEVFRHERPAPGRIALGGVEAEGDDEEAGAEGADPREGSL